MKKLIAFCMLVLALVACMAPAGMEGATVLTAENKLQGIKVCSDLRPCPNPHD